MNDTYGPVFGVSRAEAATPEMADERAKALKGQFIMDMHTHFLRDDTKIMGFVAQRAAVGKAGWNPQLVGKEQTIEELKFANYFKEVYLDSDTKVACITGAPSEIPADWFLTNEMKVEARAKINKEAGHAPRVGACDLHARLRRLDGAGRSRDQGPETRFDEGLHDRRQLAQGSLEASVAPRRRKARLSRLREIPRRPV